MDRRTFIGVLSLASLAAPRATVAQPARKVYRIGVFNSSGKTADLAGPQTKSSTLNALIRGLRELGYVYGQDFVTEARGGESRPERFPALAAELVGLKADVIVGAGPTLPALKQATSTVPVVMAASGDPIGQGLVRSLGRPGGNFTGLSNQGIEVSGKRLELLKELAPRAALVAVLWDRDGLPYLQAAETAARERGWKLMSLEVLDAGDAQGAFKAATDAGAGALLVSAPGVLIRHARRIAELAVRSRLPAIYHLRLFVDAGGLASYSADLIEIWRRAALFVDKILKGANPADLPVEQPSKFESVINLKAAKSIGLTIPQSVLLRADEVIR